jgi:hypothetical protein
VINSEVARVGQVGDRLPLPTLLSQALVAYTIEFDNESEHLLPHRTASHGSTAGPGPKPWLASLVMWSNCMKYIGPDGVQLGELERLARTRTNLAGMQRWGYVVVTPGPADRDPKRPGPEAVLRATAGGRRAQEIWAPLFGVIDRRWHERFGADAIAYLRTALSAVADHLVELPECLPILGYGLFSALTNAGDPQHWRRLEAVEDQWQTHFGAAAVRAIRSSLEPLVGDGDAQSPLFAGLEPYSDGWRAAVRKPTTLPHFPMVLHRGGFPDGS